MALSSFNEKIRALQRLVVGHADDVVLDGAGRILVPPALRQYAALDKRVVLVGQGNKFELWDEAKWLERTEHAVAFPADGLPPELDGFSLSCGMVVMSRSCSMKPWRRWRSSPRASMSMPHSAAAGTAGEFSRSSTRADAS